MTHRVARLIVLSIAFLPSGSSHAAIDQPGLKPPADRRNFVACPVVRDTSTVPCWLAEHEGEWYYLGSQGSSASAFYPPQLGHQALIEGTVVEGPRVCGGRQLSPVRVSVMQEITPACNTVLPAEPGLTPARSPIAPAPRFPDSTREFAVPYDFDSDYLTLHTTRIAIEAARVAKAVNAGRIEVYGRRGATLLSNGQTLAEGPRIAELRATKMAENLIGLGIPADRVHATWQRDPDVPDGVTDPDRRRLTITLGDAAAGCDRACLIAMADRYLAALAKRDPSSLPLSSNVKFTENGARLTIGEGLWKVPTTLRLAARCLCGSGQRRSRGVERARRRRSADPVVGPVENPGSTHPARSRPWWRAKAATRCSRRMSLRRFPPSINRCSSRPSERLAIG